jgi:hypothetical protein
MSMDSTSETPPTTPPKPRLSRGAIGGIVAVVIVVLLVISLMLAGIIPGLHLHSSSTSPSAPTYDVNFTESGLPSGTSWSVTLAGTTTPSTGSTITFKEPAGSYSYTIGAVTGYESRPSSGGETVSTAPVTVPVAFKANLASALTASASTTQVGAAVTLTVGLSGGFSPDTWTLTVNGSSTNLSGATSGHYLFSPTQPGTYTFYLNATDAVGKVARATTAVTVRPALEAELSASPPITEVGVASVLSLSFSGGVAPVAWTLTENGSSANLTGVAGGHYTFPSLAPATYTFYLNATDHVGSVSDVTTTVTVEPPLAVALSSNLTTIPVGKTSTLSLEFSGGVAPISWTLAANGSTSNLSGASGGLYVFAPVAAGTYTFYLNATDAVGSVASSTTQVLVTPGLLSTLSASPATTQVGVNSTLTIGFIGGVPPSFWTLEVNGSLANLTAVGGQYNFTPLGPGTYTFYLNASDLGGNWSNVTAVVTVEPALEVTLSASATLISTDKTSTLTVGLSGGVHPLTWTLEENGSSANLTGVEAYTYVFAPSWAGNYTFYLNATDAVGSVSQANTTVNVTQGVRSSLTAIPSLTQVGAPSTLTIAFLGPVLASSWTLELNGSASNLSGVSSDEYVFLPPAQGTYTFFLNATDTAGDWSNVTATVTVDAQLVASLTASRTSTSVDVASTLTLGFSGGVAPILWTLTENGSILNLSGVSDGKYVFDPSAAGTFTFYLNATDNVGSTSDVTATVTVTPATLYAVTFSESGLALDSSWTVSLGGVTASSTGSGLTIHLPNGSYDFAAGAAGYTASPGFAPLTIAGNSVGETIHFTAEATVGDFAVTFTQTGLTNSSQWTVGVEENESGVLYGTGEASEGGTIEVAVPNGTYLWYAESVSGYVPETDNGTITIAGHDVSQSIVFNQTYYVNFTATGLTYGMYWTTDIAGQEQTEYSYYNATFSLPNGTYSFTANSTGTTAVPDSGSITVDGASVNQTIAFTLGTTYAVSFTESGLATNTFWSVEMDGLSEGGMAGSLVPTFDLADGTYVFAVTVYSSEPYVASPEYGTITVSGTATSQPIVFTIPTTYPVTFTETGLVLGTEWYVDLNGTYGSSFSTTIEINETPGTYNFSIGLLVFNYSISPASGSITVTSGPASQGVTFTPETMYAVTVTEAGLPSGADWEVELETNLSGAYFFGESTDSVATVEAPDGNYTVGIDALASPGYIALPSTSSVEIDGHGLNESVTFAYAPQDHIVGFLLLNEFGLGAEFGSVPNGTAWTVTFDGITQTATGFVMFFEVPNGTYSYTISPPAGYTSWPASGTLGVNASFTGFTLFGDAYVELDFHATEGGIPGPVPAGPAPSGLALASWLPALPLSGSRSAG